MGQYKQGLDYFPFSIGLLKDRKLRKPKLKHGCIVNDIYLSLLELIYGDKGYYLVYDEDTKDDIIWEILENLQGKYCPNAETVEQVIGDLVACGLFSGDHFESEILTSKRIQQTYYSATVERKAVDVDFDIWFLTREEMEKLSTKSLILAKFLNRSNEQANRSNDEPNRSNEQESKVKESKENKSIEDSNSAESAAPIPKRFTKPTYQEVAEYCKERKNNVDPQRFIDFYESKGWKVGNQPMKDWKACIRSWENRNVVLNRRQQRERDTAIYKNLYGLLREEDADGQSNSGDNI